MGVGTRSVRGGAARDTSSTVRWDAARHVPRDGGRVFEDEATAASLNQHYVSIKVDREERPYVDAVDM